MTPYLALFITDYSPVSSHSSGIWSYVVIYHLSRFIIWLSHVFGNDYGLAIFIFALLIRLLLLPILCMQRFQSQQLVIANPLLSFLHRRFSARYPGNLLRFQRSRRRLFDELNVHPMLYLVLMFAQLPFLWALYQAIRRTPVLMSKSFLGIKLASTHNLGFSLLVICLSGISVFCSLISHRGSAIFKSFIIAAFMIFYLVVVYRLPLAILMYWIASSLTNILRIFLVQNPFRLRSYSNLLARQSHYVENYRRKHMNKYHYRNYRFIRKHNLDLLTRQYILHLRRHGKYNPKDINKIKRSVKLYEFNRGVTKNV